MMTCDDHYCWEGCGGSLDSNYTPHLRHQNARQVMMLSFPQLTEGSTVEHLR